MNVWINSRVIQRLFIFSPAELKNFSLETSSSSLSAWNLLSEKSNFNGKHMQQMNFVGLKVVFPIAFSLLKKGNSKKSHHQIVTLFPMKKQKLSNRGRMWYYKNINCKSWKTIFNIFYLGIKTKLRKRLWKRKETLQ